MAVAKAKTINLLLNEGTLNGVISIADSSWNSGELFSAPRDSIDDLLESEACDKYGVYLLLSKEMVYVGQSSDLSKRIKQHIVGKDWWERVIVLTTSDDSLNRSDIDYLEAILIKKASENNKLDCDNKNTGNRIKISKFRKVFLEQYMEEAMFLMELIGITVFCKDKDTDNSSLINSVVTSTKDQIEIRAKREALAFLKDNSVILGECINYAKRLETKEEFWVNPRTEVLEKDWNLVLNNQYKKEITVLTIPAYTFQLNDDGQEGFYVRADKNFYIDLRIEEQGLVDKRSKIRLVEYITKRIRY